MAIVWPVSFAIMCVGCSLVWVLVCALVACVVSLFWPCHEDWVDAKALAVSRLVALHRGWPRAAPEKTDFYSVLRALVVAEQHNQHS